MNQYHTPVSTWNESNGFLDNHHFETGFFYS